MYCKKCGNKLKDGVLFCPKCGEQVLTESNNNDNNHDYNNHDYNNHDNNHKNPLLIVVLVIFIVIIILLAAILVMLLGGNKRASVSSENSKVYEREQSSEINTDMEKVDNIDNNADNIVDNVANDNADVISEAENLYVTVPTQSMSLRQTAGFGDDIITELGSNVYLIYAGETQTVNDTEFYKVTVRDTGQTGYLAADYCIKVRFEYNESDLDIVEVDNALYTYEMMVSDMKELAARYPDIVSYEELGATYDGRVIYGISFGNPDAQNHIMVQSTIHGREYMNTQLVMRMIEYYAYYYDTGLYNGVTYRELFDNTSFYILPMVNPDGVSISQFGVDGIRSSYYQELIYDCYERDKYYMVYKEDSEGDMYWDDLYKDENFDRSELGDIPEITFEEYTRDWKSNAAGVDLNRNFDAGWQNIDEKTLPSYGNFKGDYVVSEPETQILKEAARKMDFKYYVSYHSKGNLIYYDTPDNKEDTSRRSESLAVLFENHIKFKKIDTSKSTNTTQGGFNDWVQLGLSGSGVTIESGKHRCPLDISEFMPMWLRHRESWAMLASSI